MLNKYILLKSENNIESPYLIDFLKGFLGYDIEIKKEDNILSIFYSMNDMSMLYSGISALISEFDIKIEAYISNECKEEDLELNYKIIVQYFKSIDLNETIYTEEKFLTELVLKGHKDGLDRLVFKGLYNDSNMLECIKVFIENDMNTSKSADRLYLHRNTLINKIEKFKDVTGYNVKKFSNAFIIYHLLKK